MVDVSNKLYQSFKNTVIKLDCDVNLNGKIIYPLGGGNRAGGFFRGTFDGQGHTFYNFKGQYGSGSTVRQSNPGLFGVISGATIKNLTIDGADIIDYAWGSFGLLAGCASSEDGKIDNVIENVHIKNSIVRRYNDSDTYQEPKVGLFFGLVNGKNGSDVIIRNCSVTNSAAINNTNIEKLYPLNNGYYGSNEKDEKTWKPTIENSTVTNVICGSVRRDKGVDVRTVKLEDILSGAVTVYTK